VLHDRYNRLSSTTCTVLCVIWGMWLSFPIIYYSVYITLSLCCVMDVTGFPSDKSHSLTVQSADALPRTFLVKENIIQHISQLSMKTGLKHIRYRNMYRYWNFLPSYSNSVSIVNTHWTNGEHTLIEQWTLNKQTVNVQWTNSECSINKQWMLNKQTVNAQYTNNEQSINKHWMLNICLFDWLFIAAWAIFQLSGGCHH
jgi:hypothetical protein